LLVFDRFLVSGHGLARREKLFQAVITPRLGNLIKIGLRGMSHPIPTEIVCSDHLMLVVVPGHVFGEQLLDVIVLGE
jgi:hypothetical protein